MDGGGKPIFCEGLVVQECLFSPSTFFFSHFSLTPNPIKGKNEAVVHPSLEIQ